MELTLSTRSKRVPLPTCTIACTEYCTGTGIGTGAPVVTGTGPRTGTAVHVTGTGPVTGSVVVVPVVLLLLCL